MKKAFLYFFLCSSAIAGIPYFWLNIDIAVGNFGYPSCFSTHLARLGIGLPPPYGFGVGTEGASVSLFPADMEGIPISASLSFLPLNIYYTPFIRYNQEGRPTHALYAFISINRWLVSVLPSGPEERSPAHFVKAGLAFDFLNLPQHLTILGIHLGYVEYRPIDLQSFKRWSSFYIEISGSFPNWHWVKMGGRH